ncbi:hypothetical protein RRG08_033448 [Elysia crispata]|uniref:Uncharacterized protein n=1 Tax=Elysia crispata TaxID=231223 RepID=A0AAE1AUX7_9GAST|nr:hypothetical protein RRG08_033448 [Elysia crispata]
MLRSRMREPIRLTFLTDRSKWVETWRGDTVKSLSRDRGTYDLASLHSHSLETCRSNSSGMVIRSALIPQYYPPGSARHQVQIQNTALLPARGAADLPGVRVLLPGRRAPSSSQGGCKVKGVFKQLNSRPGQGPGQGRGTTPPDTEAAASEPGQNKT